MKHLGFEIWRITAFTKFLVWFQRLVSPLLMFSCCTQDAGQLAELARLWGSGCKVLQGGIRIWICREKIVESMMRQNAKTQLFGLLDHYWGREDHHRSSCCMSEIYFHRGDPRSPMVPWTDQAAWSQREGFEALDAQCLRLRCAA